MTVRSTVNRCPDNRRFCSDQTALFGFENHTTRSSNFHAIPYFFIAVTLLRTSTRFVERLNPESQSSDANDFDTKRCCIWPRLHHETCPYPKPTFQRLTHVLSIHRRWEQVDLLTPVIRSNRLPDFLLSVGWRNTAILSSGKRKRISPLGKVFFRRRRQSVNVGVTAIGVGAFQPHPIQAAPFLVSTEEPD